VALGRFFTVQVAVHQDHQVVRAGPYRRLRHPAYSGALIAFLGLGVLTGSALSLAIILAGTGAAFLYRIEVEERALRSRLGADYAEYARATNRLIPFVY
jgi:protein-S-isoprenylcysteine O-methyltransferase